MKKLYTLVFLIINFNQILCSAAALAINSVDEAQVRAEAKTEAEAQAKVAKVAALKTLAEKLGVKESDLRSMGVSNWVRVSVLRGKPLAEDQLAEDQRLLLRLQKAFIEKLRFPSIDTDNAIESLTALLDINNLLTDKSHRLTITDIFGSVTNSDIKLQVMGDLIRKFAGLKIDEEGIITSSDGKEVNAFAKLVLDNITDVNMKRVLLDLALNGARNVDKIGNDIGFLEKLIKSPTAKFSLSFRTGMQSYLKDINTEQYANDISSVVSEELYNYLKAFSDNEQDIYLRQQRENVGLPVNVPEDLGI